ncbi:MAG: helix-turn-helix domain-containing protein [Candidatus Caldatribacteriota bacterium]|nr:helix-turn-helix domain-containing protein [Candidatus Caldatribacteriota bacterium]
MGVGPVVLYQGLLTYCHKEKYIAWPTLATLSSKLGISKNSLLSYRKTLFRYGLIKKIIKRRTARGNYQSNFYKVTPMEGSAKIELRQVQILHPNNTNTNNTNITTTNREKDTVVVVVNFKKLKKKGEENTWF